MDWMSFAGRSFAYMSGEAQEEGEPLQWSREHEVKGEFDSGLLNGRG